ncbi:MAG: hypothetical protein LUI13_02040, partial [Lachnospiraceae bacterium]|nr:hypothetical protein [Lachnospiraceae bacterium]
MTFDDITARVKKISKETMAEVQKMNEVRGLNSQISAEKKKIREMYTEMGKKLYDRYKEEPLEGFESDFHSLDQAFGMIEELQGLIRAAKGVTLCPNCKMEVSVMERFCSNCGCKMPEEYRIEMEEESVIEDNAQADDAASEEPEIGGEADAEEGETAEDLSETAEEAEAAEDSPETAKEAEAAEDSPETENGAAAKDEPEEA